MASTFNSDESLSSSWRILIKQLDKHSLHFRLQVKPLRPEEDAGDLWLVGGQAIENQTQVDASVDPTSVEATKIDDPCFCTIMDGKED